MGNESLTDVLPPPQSADVVSGCAADFGSYIDQRGGGWGGLNWYIFSFMLVTQVRGRLLLSVFGKDGSLDDLLAGLQYVGALGVYNIVVGRLSEIVFVMFLLTLNLCFYAWIMGSISGGFPPNPGSLVECPVCFD